MRLTSSPRLLAAVVVLLGAACWLPSLFGGYPLDDDHLARAWDPTGQPRPLVHDLQSLSFYFGTHWWQGYHQSSDLYRPVSKMGLALVHWLFGRHLPADLAALPQHLVNLLLHAWAVWLVMRLVRAVCDWPPAALCAGLVFGLHALKSEAICTIVGRTEVAGFAFGAQALLCLAAGRGALVWRLPLAMLCFFLAFGSKENAVAWVGFAPLFLAVAGGGWRRARLALLAAVPAAALFLLLRHQVIAAQTDVMPVTWSANPLVDLSGPERWPPAIAILGYGLGKTLFPIGLAADHGPAVFAPLAGIGDVRTIASAAVLAALLGLGVAGWRRRPLLSLAVAAFFVFSLPTANLAFPIGTQFAERLYYAPSLGLALFVAWVLAATRHLEGWAITQVVLVLWLGHNAVYAFRRSLDWCDTRTIVLHDVAVRPQSAYLQLLAGDAKVKSGDVEGGRQHYEQAVLLNPRLTGGWVNLGVRYQMAGRLADSERALRAGLAAAERWPRETSTGERAALHMNLGILLGGLGRVDESFEHLLWAATLEPESARRESAFLGMVQELAGRGEREKVATALSRLATMPLPPEARLRLQALLQRRPR